MNYKKFENKSAARLGNFGDNSAFGGSVVNVGKRKIHIQGGVEKSIWDAYKKDPKKAESILAARIGVTPETASVNEKTGYRQYNENESWWDRQMGKVGKAVGVDIGTPSPVDLYNQTFDKGRYDPLEQQKGQLQDMLDPTIGSIIKGTEKMGTFLEDQFTTQMDRLGEKRESLWEGLSTAQDQMGATYQNVMTAGAKTGLITTGGQSEAVESLEKQGDLVMGNIGREQKYLGFEEDDLRTQLDIDKLKAQQMAETSIHSIIGDYMAATGEPIGDQYIDLLTEIQDESSVSDLEGYSTT